MSMAVARSLAPSKDRTPGPPVKEASVPDVDELVQVLERIPLVVSIEHGKDGFGHVPGAFFPALVTDARVRAELNLKESLAGDPGPQDLNLFHAHGYRRRSPDTLWHTPEPQLTPYAPRLVFFLHPGASLEVS